jgi:hypothetical protein
MRISLLSPLKVQFFFFRVATHDPATISTLIRRRSEEMA